MITRRRITQVVNLGILGYHNVEFEVLYSPGASGAGQFGPPENYDPGKASEIDILKATLNGMDVTALLEPSSAVHDRIIDELDADDLEDRRELASENT